MSDARFDISFGGTLKADADPAWTREQLRVIFKLDEPGLARLFSGKPVLIKRNVDAATAARYKRAFDEAGAVVDVLAAEEPSPSSQAGGDGEVRSESPPAEGTRKPSGLGLAPMGGFLEEPPEVKMAELDISYLSLAPGHEWTLADCEPDPPDIDPPDISHLELTDRDVPSDDESRS